MAAEFVWCMPTRAWYALARKRYTGGLVARLRAFWHYVVRGYRYEICGECGCPVGLVWSAPDDLWLKVNGQDGGIWCLPCFDAAADEIKEPLHWVARPLTEDDPAEVAREGAVSHGD